MIHDSRPRFSLGVTLNLIAWFLFTIMTALSKKAQGSNTVAVILCVQNLIGVLSLAPYLIKHLRTRYSGRTWILLFTRIFAGQINMLFLFLAVKRLSLSNAMLINNTAPIIVPLILFFLFKQRIKLLVWMAILLGFFGIMLILPPSQGIIDIGALFALIAALFLSIVLIVLREIAFKIHPVIVLFYFFLIGFIFSLPFAYPFWASIKTEDWLLLSTIGILQVLGQYFLVKSFHFGDSSKLAPMCFSVVIYSVILDSIIAHSLPNFESLFGMLIVCLSGIWILKCSSPYSLPRTPK